VKAGWAQKQLADVCDVFTDGDWIESKDQSGEGIRLIQTGNVGEGRFKDRGDKARFISADTFRRLKCTEIFQGDCIISRLPDPVGRSCMLPDTAGERMITAVDCTVVRFKPTKVIPEFFVYYTQSTDYLKAAARACSGATRQRISRSKLGDIALPVPPLAEQKRIVAILDQAFEAIDTAKGNAEKNLLKAKEIFDSYLSSYSAETVPLGDLVNIMTGKLDANAAVDGGIYPFFTCAKEVYAINNYAFDTEAILLAGNNAVGEFNVKHYRGKFNAYQRTYVITLKDGAPLRYRHLYYQLVRNLGAFKKRSVGSGTKFLKLPMIKELQIALPTIREQDRLVADLDCLTNAARRLSEVNVKRIALLNEFGSALLTQAFSGELAA
jgi:type I restriction enzyme S subunit